MDRPRNPDEDEAFRRRVAESVNSESDSEGAVGSASYAMAREGGGGGGGDDEHAATAVDGSPIDDTHEASAVGGGTIYSTAPDDGATEDPLDASGMQSGQASQSGGALPPAPPIDGGAGGRPPSGVAADSSNTPPPPPPERGYDERGQPIPNFEDGGTTESSDDGPETYTVRDGVTRAIDPEDYSTIRNEQELTQESTHSRAESVSGFNPDAGLARPPDLPESVQVTDVAPDGTSIGGGGGLTSPTGEAIAGSGLSDAIQGRAGTLGGDALGRGLDFDPSSPGTNDAGPGGQESTGDPTVDRAIQENDGSLFSAERGADKVGGVVLDVYDEALAPRPPKPVEEPKGDGGSVWYNPFTWFNDEEKPEDFKPIPKTTPGADPYYESAEGGGSGESVTNLERVRVMQGSAVNPSTNPNDGGDSGTTDNYIPPADLETMPAQEGDVEATTLTSSATLGSSPVVNPTDPVLGDEGRMEGSYAGGGGGEVMPTSMAANDASALGGQGEANLPITLEPAPAPAGGASALGGQGEANLPITLEPAPVPAGADALSGKEDVNGATVDMVTGQVVGSAAPAMGGELDSAGGAVSQGDEGDDDDGGVQSLGGAPSAFAAAAPMNAGLAAGGLVSQGDEGDDDDGGVQSFAGGDAAMAIGAPEPAIGGEPMGGPQGFEGPAPMGEEGPQSPGEEG